MSVWVYVCILAIKHGKNTYTHTLTEIRAIHSYTKLVDQTFSGDFWHKVSVSKNCCIFPVFGVWVYGGVPGGGYPAPPPPKKKKKKKKNTFFWPPLQNTRWKWLLEAILSHFLSPGAQGPFLRVFRVLFYTKLVYRSVCIHFLGQGGQKHTSIHTLRKQN